MEEPNAFVSPLQKPILLEMDAVRGFQLLFGHIDSVFFFVKDLEGRILFANPQLQEHYGFKRAEDLIGKTDFDFLPRSLAEKYRWDDMRVVESKEPLIKEVELFLDDQGVPDWYFTTKYPVLSRHGSSIGIMGVIQKFDSSHQRFMLDKKLGRALEYLNGHFVESVQLGELARICGVSGRKLERLFKAKLNTTVRDMLIKLRLLKACDLLRLTDHSLADIAIECGFYDQSSFTRHFKRTIGLTPRHYRSKY
jgi:PAS domain S-box-containing protein